MALHPDEPGRLTQVDWYFAPEGADTFPGLAPCSLNWSNGARDGPVGIPGEVEGAPRPWRNGKAPSRLYIGKHYCGRREWYESGVPSDAPVPERDKNGVPTCCMPRFLKGGYFFSGIGEGLHGATVATGGASGGGSAVFSIEPVVLAAGGAVAGGAALWTAEAAQQGLGGGLAGGAALWAAQAAYQGLGGAVAGGAASWSAHAAQQGLGGALADGGALFSGEYSVVAASGGVAGGAALWWSSTVPRGYIDGLVLSRTAARTVRVAAGVCRDDGNTADITLANALSKNVSTTFSIGDGGGALVADSWDPNAWYHVWGIYNPSNGSNDVMVQKAATGPIMPTGFTLRRRIGAIRTDAGSNVVLFYQAGDQFLWDVPVLDVNGGGTVVGNNPLITLTVPTGVRVWAMLNVYVTGAVTEMGTLSSPDITGVGADLFCPDAQAANANPIICRSLVLTNTAGQVRWSAGGTAGNTLTSYWRTRGWIDPRGKDA